MVCFGEERPTLPSCGGVVGSCPTCVTEHRPVAVCHAALQSPTQAKQGWSFLLIVLQCRIMARLSVGMGKRESGRENGGRASKQPRGDSRLNHHIPWERENGNLEGT